MAKASDQIVDKADAVGRVDAAAAGRHVEFSLRRSW